MKKIIFQRILYWGVLKDGRMALNVKQKSLVPEAKYQACVHSIFKIRIMILKAVEVIFPKTISIIYTIFFYKNTKKIGD